MDPIERGYWEMLIGRSVSRLFLLAALSGKPMHGYELGKAITDSCGGCCEPTDAMIYPAIHDLQKRGYLVCDVETSGGRERKVCHLTDEGREAYRVAAEAWSRVLPHIAAAVEGANRNGSLDFDITTED